jgi:hypothetical protein
MYLVYALFLQTNVLARETDFSLCYTSNNHPSVLHSLHNPQSENAQWETTVKTKQIL